MDDDRTECSTCGGPLRFDPLVEGTTCGGLAMAGGLVCDGNGCDVLLSRRSIPSEAWKLAGGGRSVDAAGTRIRCEAAPNAEQLMARIVRLPDLERALRAIAAGAEDAAGVARAALGVSGG